MTDAKAITNPPKDVTHPAADIFPLMTDLEYVALKLDIEQNGQREPIAYFEGKVLDGRNRLQACRELDIEPLSRELKECDDPIAYVVSLNLHRRHLTVSQRAMIGAGINSMRGAQAKKRQREHGGTAPGRRKNTCGKIATSVTPAAKARDEVAEILNISPRTVQDAITIAKKSPELAQQMRNGELTLAEAKRKLATPNGRPTKPKAPTPDSVPITFVELPDDITKDLDVPQTNNPSYNCAQMIGKFIAAGRQKFPDEFDVLLKTQWAVGRPEYFTADEVLLRAERELYRLQIHYMRRVGKQGAAARKEFDKLIERLDLLCAKWTAIKLRLHPDDNGLIPTDDLDGPHPDTPWLQPDYCPPEIVTA